MYFKFNWIFLHLNFYNSNKIFILYRNRILNKTIINSIKINRIKGIYYKTIFLQIFWNIKNYKKNTTNKDSYKTNVWKNQEIYHQKYLKWKECVII
jgi:hypothetical protein